MRKCFFCGHEVVFQRGKHEGARGTAVPCDACGHYELTPEARACLRELDQKAKDALRDYIHATHKPGSRDAAWIKTETILKVTGKTCTAVPRDEDDRLDN